MSSICLNDEIIALQEIFYKEFSTTTNEDGSTILSVIINPDSGFDKSEDMLVSFLLKLVCPVKYPVMGPTILIEDVRGFDEEDIEGILSTLESLMKQSLGDAMLYELIMKAKEFCVENCPHATCPICMTSFKSAEDVFRTSRYHYFHRRCMAQYMAERKRIFEEELNEIMEKDPHRPEDKRPKFEIPCPTCQSVDDSIAYDKSLVDAFSSSFSIWSDPCLNEEEGVNHFEIPSEWLKIRGDLAARQSKQQDIVEMEKRNILKPSEEIVQNEIIPPNAKTEVLNDSPPVTEQLSQSCIDGSSCVPQSHHRHHHHQNPVQYNRGRRGKRFMSGGYHRDHYDSGRRYDAHRGQGYSRTDNGGNHVVSHETETRSRNNAVFSPSPREVYFDNSRSTEYHNNNRHHRTYFNNNWNYSNRPNGGAGYHSTRSHCTEQESQSHSNENNERSNTGHYSRY